MDKFLPVWIIGVPLVFAVIDWMMTPKVKNSGYGYSDHAARPAGTAASL